MENLSIVTITYKDPQGLAKTLKSLEPLSKSDLNWELVVIDSSPEENKDILINSSLKIRHFPTVPQGIYPAFNEGIAQAKGEYIWFLNGGDELASLENLIQAMNILKAKPEVKALFCSVKLMKDGKLLKQQNHFPNVIMNILGSNRLCHQGIIYHRSVFDSLGKFSLDFKVASDYEHHFRLFFSSVKTASFTKPLALFDMAGSSANVQNSLSEFGQVHNKLKGRLGTLVYGANKVLLSAVKIKKKLF